MYVSAAEKSGDATTNAALHKAALPADAVTAVEAPNAIVAASSAAGLGNSITATAAAVIGCAFCTATRLSTSRLWTLR